MAIITKEEFKKRNRHLAIDIMVMFGGTLIGLFAQNFLLSSASADTRIATLVIFLGLSWLFGFPFLLSSMDGNGRCDRCGEYYKAPHSEIECLCALRSKLDKEI